MKHIYRMRLLVKILDELCDKQDGDDFLRGFGYEPGIKRNELSLEFHKHYPRYSLSLINKIIEAALGHEFITYSGAGMVGIGERKVIVNPSQGRDLLTTTGYVNELAGSIGKVPPVITILSVPIALAALIVSILVAISK